VTEPPPTDDTRNPADILCDVLLYAPLGFAFEARRLLPELAQRGRNQVAAARVLGEFVVQRAGAQLGPDVEKLGRDVGRAVEGLLASVGLAVPPLFPVDRSPGAAEANGAAGPSAPPSTPGEGGATAAPPPGPAPTPPAGAGDPGPSAAGAPAEAVAEEGTAPAAAQLAIADYDSLAASQVVPRLASLDVAELAAVRAYEAAHRGRRTILNRVDQLLEQRGASGA